MTHRPNLSQADRDLIEDLGLADLGDRCDDLSAIDDQAAMPS